jgi:intracellular multiplication protein IcmP
MAKGAPEAPQQSGDNSLDFLWMMALLVGAILAIWYFGKTQITMAVFRARLYEIAAIQYVVTHWWAYLAEYFKFPMPDIKSLAGWVAYIHQNYGAPAEFDTLQKLSTAVGKFICYPVSIILGFLAAYLYFGSVTSKFRIVFDMKKLKLVVQKEWPRIIPVTKLDLISQSIDEGPWAMAMSPMAFCKRYKLLDVEFKEGKYIATLKKGAAHKLLSLQLGPRWYGYEALPMHLKALFAVSAARLNSDKTSGEMLLDQIAISSQGDKLNFSGAETLMRKHGNTKVVQKIVQLHGYVTTALASLLKVSREAGVLSTSEFLWLKKIDRRMWYMLNSVGRHTAIVEISGAFSHWVAENKLGLPLYVPMVDEAVRGLEIAISEVIYKPDED